MESQAIPYRPKHKTSELPPVTIEPIETIATDATSHKGNDDHGAHTTSLARAPMVDAATQTDDLDVHVNQATSHVRAPMVDATAQTDVNLNVERATAAPEVNREMGPRPQEFF